MAEEENSGNSNSGSNSVNMDENKIRGTFISISITLGLIVGPILLPFVFIKPNWFSEISYMKLITLSVTILFVLSSTIVAYRRDKSTENQSS